MTTYYNQDLSVLPFMLIREEHSQQEMTPDLWPRKLDEYQEYLRSFLYAKFATDVGPSIPVVTHLAKFKEWVVLAITIRVRADKLQDVRRGLMLTYGALVAPGQFSKTPSLAEDYFALFHDYIQRRYGVQPTVDGIENVIFQYQTGASSLAQGGARANDEFLSSIEARYGSNPGKSRLRIPSVQDLRVARTLSRFGELVSFTEVADTVPYWSEVGKGFSQGKTPRIPKGRVNPQSKPDAILSEGYLVDQQAGEEIAKLNYDTLYASFQSTISTIMMFPYLVALLIVARLGTRVLLDDAMIVTPRSLIVVSYALIGLIGVAVLLQLAERHIYLWSVWNSLRVPAKGKTLSRSQLVNMSQVRFILIIVSSLLTLFGAASLVYLCVSDASRMLQVLSR